MFQPYSPDSLREISGRRGPQGLPGVNAVPADAAVGTYVDTDGTDTQIAVDARIDNSRPGIYLPPPTGDETIDSPRIAAAITQATAASPRKAVYGRDGEYAINTLHVFGDGVDLRCEGGGSTSRTGRTIFRCTTAGSGIGFTGGGGWSGGFEVEGDDVANTPLQRAGGTGANARTFQNITVRHNTGSYPLASFVGAQNDLWTQCGFEESSQDLGYFDQGYGGAKFIRCEWAGATRYHHFYDNAISSPTYPVPADITHDMGIMERGSGTSLVATGCAIANVTYRDFDFYSETGCSGPMFDLTEGSGISLHNPWFQSTGATLISGTVGLMVRGTASVTLSGRAIFQNFDKAVQVDGVGSFVYAKCSFLFYNCTTQFSGINSGTTAQIADLKATSTTNVMASTDFVEINQPTARDRFLFSRTGAGVMSWYPNTAGNFTPDVQFLRRAAGAVGIVNGTHHVLCSGTGTTAQRPSASSPLNGALYGNTDTTQLEWCDGTSWYGSGDTSWTSPTVTNATSNPQNAAYDTVGYMKDADGDVVLHGVPGGITLNATLFTLPTPGYRPSKTKQFIVGTLNGSGVMTIGMLTIGSDGTVKLAQGAATALFLDGVRIPKADLA